MAQSVHGYLVVDEYFRPGSVYSDHYYLICVISISRSAMHKFIAKTRTPVDSQ